MSHYYLLKQCIKRLYFMVECLSIVISFSFSFKLTYFLIFQEFPINPKALSLGELYGEFDLNTNEWTDGVLSSVMRLTCSGKY